MAKNRRLVLAVGIFIIFCISCRTISAYAAQHPIRYERSYPNGSSSNDSDPENIVTVDPQVMGEPSSFSLRYYPVNKTLIIDQNNIENLTLYWDRAIKEVVGDDGLDYYASQLLDKIYVKVYGSGGSKNLTLKNLPRVPSSIYKDGERLDYEVIDDDTVKLTINPTGNYTINFGGIGGPGGILDEVEDILDNLCLSTCMIIVVLAIISAVVILRMRKK